MAMSAAERQRRSRERRRGPGEVRAGEAELAAGTEERVSGVALEEPDLKLVRAVLENEFRQMVERAEAEFKAGRLPDAGRIFVRGQVSLIWDRVRARLRQEAQAASGGVG